MATKSSSFCSRTINRGLGAYHCQPRPHFTKAQVCSNVHQLNPIPASIIQLGLLVFQDPLRFMGSCRSYSEAISMYERALALYPKGASTYAALGFTYHLQVALAFLLYHCIYDGLFCMIKLKAHETSRFQRTLVVHICQFWLCVSLSSIQLPDYQSRTGFIQQFHLCFIFCSQGSIGKAIDYYHKVILFS